MEPETPARTLGVGARVGGFVAGVGVGARYWTDGELGVDLCVSHHGVGLSLSEYGVQASADYGVWGITPSVLWSLRNHDPSRSVSYRPYVGGGLHISRSALSSKASGYGVTQTSSTAATTFGGQGFVGVELGFQQLLKFTIGGDIGYYTTATPFPSLTVGGFAIGLNAHYFLK